MFNYKRFYLYLLRFKLLKFIIKIKTYFVCWSDVVSVIKKQFLKLFMKVKTYPVCWSNVASVVNKLSLSILQVIIYLYINATIDMGDIDMGDIDMYNYCDILEQIRKLKEAIQQQQDFDNAMELLAELFFTLCIPILILSFFSRFNR